ncbi:hypothetical protein GQ457_01G033160 [Hibiscus cannabinus]
MERAQEIRNQNQQATSLFVENIPEKMEWRGLWHMFARHGDVVDSFIAWRLSRGGKRFGFVRFANRNDALRAMERLNGFSVYGFRLTVKLANSRSRKKLGEGNYRIKEYAKGKKQENTDEVKAMKVQSLGREAVETSAQGGMGRRKVIGHVESEDLLKLKKCLVGVTNTVCSVHNISLRLQQWGLGDIKIQRLGGKAFLLTIEDEDLFIMLEDLEWSYLKEIFVKVECWSESLKPSRATWLEVSGIPLHCWNSTTLKSVAELWGSFEAFGENLQHRLDCEKVTILISTKQVKRIDEVVELEVGNFLYEIRVVEQGFRDSTSDLLLAKKPSHTQEVNVNSEDSSEAAFPVESDINCFAEDEALNAVFVGKDSNNIEEHAGEDVARQIGESIMSGYALKEDSLKAAVKGNKSVQESPIIEDRRNWIDIVCGGVNNLEKASSRLIVEKPIEGPDVTPLRALEDVGNMGFRFEGEMAVNKQDNWAKEIDESFNASTIKLSGLQRGVEHDEKQDKQEIRVTVGVSRESIIFHGEKEKRRKRINKQELENSELSGRSLSDSDLATRREILTKEAKKTLKLGKKLGMQIVGCEQEVVRELMLLETNY